MNKNSQLEKDPIFKGEKIDVIKVNPIVKIENFSTCNCIDYAEFESETQVLFVKH